MIVTAAARAALRVRLAVAEARQRKLGVDIAQAREDARVCTVCADYWERLQRAEVARAAMIRAELADL